MTQSDKIKEYCSRINLSYIPLKLSNIILKAQECQPTYIDFLAETLKLHDVPAYATAVGNPARIIILNKNV